MSDHHTRLNLRDRSCEPGNLFGDANVDNHRLASRGGGARVRMQAQDTDQDLNDRTEPDTDEDLPPPLEQGPHLSPNQRARRPVKKKEGPSITVNVTPQNNLRASRTGLRRAGQETLNETASRSFNVN